MNIVTLEYIGIPDGLIQRAPYQNIAFPALTNRIAGTGKNQDEELDKSITSLCDGLRDGKGMSVIAITDGRYNVVNAGNPPCYSR